MKAAICYEFGKPLVVEDITLDPPRKGEVKVRLAATAICHSDIHTIRGEARFPTVLPIVGGHESAGYVDEVGEGVTEVKAGESVLVCLLSPCGKCPNCLAGLSHLCETKFPLSNESRLHNKKGQSLTNFVQVGGFAEYTIVNECQLVHLPKEFPMDRASLLSCGVMTGFGAVVNRARVQPLSSVVVVGTGGVGLNAIQGAAFAGANPVIAIDVLDNKLEAAHSFGATHTINAKKVDPVKTVKEITHGRGTDYAFTVVGSKTAIKQAMQMLGPRGMVVMISMPEGKDEMINIPPMEFANGENVFTTCLMGSTNLHKDVPKLMELYLGGRLKLDELITGRYPLDKINEAIISVEAGEALRNVIVF